MCIYYDDEEDECTNIYMYDGRNFNCKYADNFKKCPEYEER